jgi:hypothetical protein
MHEYVLLMHVNPRLFAEDDKLTCMCQELTQTALKQEAKVKFIGITWTQNLKKFKKLKN